MLTYILLNDGSLQRGVQPKDSLVHLAALTRLQAWPFNKHYYR